MSHSTSRYAVNSRKNGKRMQQSGFRQVRYLCFFIIVSALEQFLNLEVSIEMLTLAVIIQYQSFACSVQGLLQS